MTAAADDATDPIGRIFPRQRVVRLLATSTLVNTFGNGLFLTLSALFFTRIVGLSVGHVGVGLTIAGGLGVLVGIPAGHLSDRFGTRGPLIALLFVDAAATVALTTVHTYAGFLLVMCVAVMADRAGSAIRSAMYAVVIPAESRTQVRAYLRAVTNVGIGAGAAVASLALQADTRFAYVAMLLVDAGTYVVAAALLLGVHPPGAVARRPEREDRRNAALRDRPYLTVTVLNAVMTVHFTVTEIGVPLWIVGHTHAPRVLVAVCLILNTVMIVLLQVRASRGITSVDSAARACRRAGVLLAVAFVLYAAAHGPAAWVAAVFLVAGTVVQAVAELISSSGGWALSYDLADPDRPGAYQGVFSSGFALAGMLGPLIVTFTALRFGWPGWITLAVVLAAAGWALVPAGRWAETRRLANANTR